MSELWGEAADAASDWSMPHDAEIEARLAAEAPGAPAEEPAAPAPEPVDLSDEDVEAPGRERDEQGRFVAKEQDPSPEPQVQAETERLYAGKYRSAEEMERAYEEAQRRLGEQGNELGQLRQIAEQIAQAQQQPQQPQPHLDWQAMLEVDPVAAADYAQQVGNEVAWRQAMQAMADEHGPGFARMYVRTAQAEHAAQQAFAAQQQALAPVQEKLEHDQWAAEIRQFTAQNEWFGELSNDELIGAAERNPLVAQILQTGSPDAKVQALRTIALDAQHARGRQNGDTLATARDIAKAQTEASIAAKNEAILASATANTEGGPKLSPAEQFAEKIGAEWEARRAVFDSGWNV